MAAIIVPPLVTGQPAQKELATSLSCSVTVNLSVYMSIARKRGFGVLLHTEAPWALDGSFKRATRVQNGTCLQLCARLNEMHWYLDTTSQLPAGIHTLSVAVVLPFL